MQRDKYLSLYQRTTSSEMDPASSLHQAFLPSALPTHELHDAAIATVDRPIFRTKPEGSLVEKCDIIGMRRQFCGLFQSFRGG